MRLPMVDCRSLIEFCRAFEQHRNMNSNTHGHGGSTNPRSSKKNSSHTIVNPLSYPFCHLSPFAAIDVFLLILVVGALGFLIIPYFRLIFHQTLDLLPALCDVVGEIIYDAPAAYFVGLVAAFSGLIVTIAAWEILEFKSRKCGKPHCKGLRKAVEFDIQLESEECVKYMVPAKADCGVKPLELGQDRMELEAELSAVLFSCSLVG